jgi:hypothetical protein
MKTSWIIADKEGIRKNLGTRGFSFVLNEMVQNAIDENITKVEIDLPRPVNGSTTLRVTDDSPDGWHDLSHSYTMFAESYKRSNPEKRGRFNIGEKFVLALCTEATISTMNGRVSFNADDTRTESTRVRRERGTEFLGTMRLKIEEWEEMVEGAKRLIPPSGVTIIVNGVAISSHKPVLSWKANLPSVIPDEEGRLRPTKRDTTITLYSVEQGETPTLYEMGIPVVEFEGKYHVSIGQKVPLNFDRDNVTPAYRSNVLVEVLNHTADLLTKEEINQPWVKVAASDNRVTPEAITTVLDNTFGTNRVSSRPGDPEADKIAITEGFTLVPGGAMTPGMWENAKKAGAIAPPPPSPKAHFSSYGQGPITRDKWTQGMCELEQFAMHVARVVLGKPVSVHFYSDSGGQNWRACYGSDSLKFAKRECGGNRFFDGGAKAHFREWVELLIHEFAHDKVSDHLSSEFHGECCRIGATYAAHLQRELVAASADEPMASDEAVRDWGQA